MTNSNVVAIRLIVVLALAGVCGCASVRPTEPALDPVQVYIGDYGIHSSLFLPTQDGRFVEYAFGDWRYAAENRNMPQDAIGALTVSGGAGFGRIYHPCCGKTAGPNPTRKPLFMQEVTCERSDVYALIDRLDVRYEQLAAKYGPPLLNPDTKMLWVREEPDKRYSIANNCNHMTARALRELGCEVSGLVVWSKFSVSDAPAPPRAASRSPEQIPGWAAID